jgi:hypothetical protein
LKSRPKKPVPLAQTVDPPVSYVYAVGKVKPIPRLSLEKLPVGKGRTGKTDPQVFHEVLSNMERYLSSFAG